jgi:hypothetical protein
MPTIRQLRRQARLKHERKLGIVGPETQRHLAKLARLSTQARKQTSAARKKARLKSWVQKYKTAWLAAIRTQNAYQIRRLKCKARSFASKHIVRPTVCPRCGRSAPIIHLHHTSFSDPLAVKPLCHDCRMLELGYDKPDTMFKDPDWVRDFTPIR